jgi:hypothetical protein
VVPEPLTATLAFSVAPSKKLNAAWAEAPVEGLFTLINFTTASWLLEMSSGVVGDIVPMPTFPLVGKVLVCPRARLEPLNKKSNARLAIVPDRIFEFTY